MTDTPVRCSRFATFAAGTPTVAERGQFYQWEVWSSLTKDQRGLLGSPLLDQLRMRKMGASHFAGQRSFLMCGKAL